MKKVKILFLAIVAIFAIDLQTLQAQDYAKAGAAYTAASEAFENKQYAVALEQIAVVEQAMGKTAQTRYIRIVSYYNLKDYEKCIAVAREYQQNPPEDDGNAAEIRRIYNDAQTKVKQQVAQREKRAEFEKEQAAAWKK